MEIGEKHMDTTERSMIVCVLSIHAFMHAYVLIGAEIEQHIEDFSIAATTDTSNAAGGWDFICYNHL